MKSLLIALVLLFYGAVSAHAAQPAGGDAASVSGRSTAEEAAFARGVIVGLAAAHPEATFQSRASDPLVIDVNAGQWNNTQLYLYRLYTFCQTASANACDAARTNFVGAVLGRRPTARRENLRVIVRNADYIDQALAKAGKEPQPWFFVRKIGDDLYEALALDGSSAIGLVSAADLHTMKLKPQEAWALGRSQTRVRLPPLPDPAALLSEPVTFEGDQYMGSILADTEGWQAIRDAIGPDLFVTITSDQFVLASLAGEGPALEQFAKAVVQDCKAAEHCISPHIYRLEDKMWVIIK